MRKKAGHLNGKLVGVEEGGIATKSGITKEKANFQSMKKNQKNGGGN